MPAVSRSYEHAASTFTCASNVFSIYDNQGVVQSIPYTITEPSNFFYQDVKSILTEINMLEAFDDSRNVIKVFGQEYTIVVLNCLERCYNTAQNTTPMNPNNGVTERYATPIPAIFRNGQSWINEDRYFVNTNSAIHITPGAGGFGVGNGVSGARTNNGTYERQQDTYFHPIKKIYGGRVYWECIRRTGKTNTNNSFVTGKDSDFANAQLPLQTLATSIRYNANDYRYSLNCYYNTNYIYIAFGLKARNYLIPFCFMAKGMDKDGKNLHYFTCDPSSATPLYAGSHGVTDTLSFNTGQQMYFSTYIPSGVANGTNVYNNGAHRCNNIKQKTYTLHNLISLDESEMQEINGYQIYKTINQHQTSPGLLFNTYDNFSSQNHVPRYTPHQTGETYKIPLKLKHGYGEFENIFYTPDMTLVYNSFYEIDGETYYLVGHDYRTDFPYYYYNVLLKM